MKKCKDCKTVSRNKTYPGDTNPYNVEYCQPCAMIRQMLDVIEQSMNGPNILGQVRKVKITAVITK